MELKKAVAAPTAFKGTLDAVQAAEAVAEGIRAASPGCEAVTLPLSDGGDGFVSVLERLGRGTLRFFTVPDPLDRPVRAPVCFLPGPGRAAAVESARAAGLALLAPGERDPLRASTRGVGELMLRALDGGARTLLVGVGGTAACDGGTGMARALGVRFLDRAGRPIARPCGGVLRRVASVDLSARDPRIGACTVEAALDVRNPLLGAEGAARVYAPQKGAGPGEAARLEEGLARLAEVVRKDLGLDAASVPGAGAGGGLGAGLLAFAGARLRPGFELVAGTVDLEARIAGADLVITGEGRLDGQTLYGKAPARVAALAGRMGIPCIVLAGRVELDPAAVREAGFLDARGIGGGREGRLPGPAEAREALRRGAEAAVRAFLARR